MGAIQIFGRHECLVPDAKHPRAHRAEIAEFSEAS